MSDLTLACCPFLTFLDRDQQLYMRSFGRRSTTNGPATAFVPCGARYEVRNALVLEDTQSAVLLDEYTGEKTNVVGPRMHFMSESERILDRHNAIKIAETQFLRVSNSEGVERAIRGPDKYFLKANETNMGVEEAIKLTENQYVHVADRRTGAVRQVRGPQLFFREVFEKVTIPPTDALLLKEGEFVRLVDREGKIRVERGETKVFLDPFDEVVEGPRQGITIDAKHAVIVRDIASGKKRLVTEHQVFIPTAEEEIVRAQELVRLESYETCVIVDVNTGALEFRDGPAQFFLEPNSKLYEQWWSAGVLKDKRSLCITKLDKRSTYMWFRFTASSKDQLRLELDITFFWSIQDVATMVKATSDASGDVCSHARAQVIAALARLTFEEFLRDASAIISNAVLSDGSREFHNARGIHVESVELRSVGTPDKAAQNALHQVVEAETRRLTLVQSARAEAEVSMARLDGEAAIAQKRSELLKLQEEHAAQSGANEGIAEARRVSTFLEQAGTGLGQDQSLALFHALRQTETMKTLAESNAHIYLTPGDVSYRMNLDA